MSFSSLEFKLNKMQATKNIQEFCYCVEPRKWWTHAGHHICTRFAREKHKEFFENGSLTLLLKTTITTI